MTSIGTRVRVVSRAALFERGGIGSDRPLLEPAQIACAGRTAVVVSARRGPDGRFGLVLEGLPGLWPESCVETRDAGEASAG